MAKDPWRDFSSGSWRETIDVRDFIQRNYAAHNGDGAFLTGPTRRTLNIWTRVQELFQEERRRGGVLDIDTERISSLLSWPPGYIGGDMELIVGLQTDKPLRRGVNPFGGIRMARAACESYGYKLGKKIEEIFSYRTTHNDGVFHVYTDEMKAVRKSGIITGLPDAYGRGRIIGDYRRVALYGVDTLIRARLADKAALGQKPMSDEVIRLSEEIWKQIDFLQKLKAMARMYSFLDISRPAYTAQEAVQWTYFAYLGAIKEQNGAAMSLGRVSTFFDVYFQRDIAEGLLTEEETQEIVDDFVIKLRMARQLRTPEYNQLFAGDPTWVTEAIGGVGEDGRSLVTKTSYRFLHTLRNLGPAPEPNLTVLWSKDSPDPWKAFCSQISIETDSIQYENDDLMRPLYGDDYGIACCVSAMRIGKQMQYFGARCNLPKVLLLAINGGRDENTGERIGPQMVPLTAGALEFDEVARRFSIYRDWLSELYVNTMNVIHYMHDKYAYEKLQMALHDADVERLMAFGVAGLSVVADSLSAVKHARVWPVVNGDGVVVDYRIEGDFPKFGNDDPAVDDIAANVVRDFHASLVRTPAYRDAVHTLSILTITSNVVYGHATGSTPDGRKAGEPFAPGANPMHRRDISGALASLNSVARIPYECCRDGVSCTFSISPPAVGRAIGDQTANLVSVLDGYFVQGGHHLNVNVLNREHLVEAMEHPERHPHLTIRVSGYAVNFHSLSREQQEEVIARTFHCSL